MMCSTKWNSIRETMFRAQLKEWGSGPWAVHPMTARPNKSPVHSTDRHPVKCLSGIWKDRPSRHSGAIGTNKRGTRFVDITDDKPRLRLALCDVGFRPKQEDVVIAPDGAEFAVHNVELDEGILELALTGPKG